MSTNVHKLTNAILILLTLVVGAAFGWEANQQVNIDNTQNTYYQQARILVNDIHQIMVEAEALNKLTMNVWYYSTKRFNDRQGDSSYYTSYEVWDQFFNTNASMENTDDEDQIRQYIWIKGSGYIEPSQAIENLLMDDKFMSKQENLKSRISKIEQSMLTLNPADRSDLSYQKLLKIYSIFIQYTNRTFTPTGNYIYSSATLTNLSMQYIQLHNELIIEIPIN